MRVNIRGDPENAPFTAKFSRTERDQARKSQ